MSGRDRLPDKSSDKSVAEFLERAKVVPAPATRGEPQGRLLFAMDATASREPAWDKAARIQGEMFRAAEAVGVFTQRMTKGLPVFTPVLIHTLFICKYS